MRKYGIQNLRFKIRHGQINQMPRSLEHIFLKFIFFTDNNKVSVRNTATTAAGKFDEICGYADIPNPETAPAELLVIFL